MKRSPSLLPILAVMTGAAISASSGLYIKTLALSSLALTGFRTGIPALIMLPAMVRNGRALGLPGRRKALWVASSLNAVRILFYVMAFKLTSVGEAETVYFQNAVGAIVYLPFLAAEIGSAPVGDLALGVMVGVLVLGESFMPSQIIGAVMVLSASLIAQRLRSAEPAGDPRS